MKKTVLYLLATLLVVSSLLGNPAPAGATPDFSAQTQLACGHCHEDPDGGGTLTPSGDAFRAAGWTLPAAARPPLVAPPAPPGPRVPPRPGRFHLAGRHLLCPPFHGS
ncbi:MAG: hypothetical protein AB1896_12360 [Thermodesulfobacteriota bacterium]